MSSRLQPRSGPGLATTSRGSDHLNVNAGQLGLVGVVLSASFVLVEGAEEAWCHGQGRSSRQRRRLLPARMVVYYVLALALFADVAYLEVLRLLVEALRRPGRRHADPG